MTQVFLNGIPHTPENSPQTWGELLAALDAHAARSGLVLSEARFDGVDLPAFRDPEATSRSLGDVARIDVQTAAPSAFLRDCLLETIASLQAVAAEAERLGALYRGDDLAEAHDGLARLSNELGAAAAIADVLAGPVGIDLDTVSDEGLTAAQHLQQLGASLDGLVAAQEARDWLTVADVLEYDLEPAIRRWASLLARLAERLP